MKEKGICTAVTLKLWCSLWKEAVTLIDAMLEDAIALDRYIIDSSSRLTINKFELVYKYKTIGLTRMPHKVIEMEFHEKILLYYLYKSFINICQN